MQKLHEDLSQKVSWYQRWHERDSHQYFHFIIFGAVTILAGVILLGQIDSYARAFDGDESYPLAQSLNKENSRAISDLKDFEISTGAKKQEKIQDLRKLLGSRKEKILERMKNGDPSLAAGFLPDEIRSRMPDTVRDLVEEKVSLSGNLSVIFVDTIKEEDSYLEYGLEVYDDSSEETTGYQLLFAKGHQPLKNGSKIKVSGYKLDNKVFVAADSGQAGTQVLSEPVLEEAVGNKSLLVIPVSFTDNTAQPISQTNLYNAYFVNNNSTSNLIKEGSYGQVVFTGAVTPWMQINANISSGCNYTTWGSLADQMAVAAGYNISNYDHVQYYLNGVDASTICKWGGLGYLRGTRSWINGAYAAHGTKAHELGHNFGAYHSGFMSCGSQQIATLSTCYFNNYGESNEKMGPANNFQFSSPKRSLFGWIPSSQILPISTSATYTLASDYSTSTTQPKILKIAKYDTNDNYYVTFKQALGFNISLGSGNTRGASVYYKPNTAYYGTYKSNPSDTVLLTAKLGGGYTDSALWDGASFVDSINGITITQLSHTADTVTLDVKLSTPPCTPANPTVSVSPASKTGSSGSTLSYTAAITNKNSTYCAVSSFTVSPLVPVGFTAAPVSVSLGPNSSANVNFSVTSNVGTLDGSYPYTVEALDTANSGKSSTQATYIVYTPVPDTTPPAVNISSPTSGAKVSGRTSITVSATDNVGVSKVEFYIDNKLTTTDTTAPYSYTWNVNKKVSNGTHTIMVKAYDAAQNSASASVSVTK